MREAILVPPSALAVTLATTIALVPTLALLLSLSFSAGPFIPAMPDILKQLSQCTAEHIGPLFGLK